MSNIKTVSLEQISAMQRRGEVKAPRDDAKAYDMPDNFWDDAKIVVPKPKKAVHLRIDAEVWDFFRAGGKGHLTRMNLVLRSYVEAQKRHKNIEASVKNRVPIVR